MLQALTVEHINGEAPSSQIGLIAKEGGLITLDTKLGFYFKGLHIGTAGTGGIVLVRGVNNNIIPFKGMLNGSWIYVLGYEVVTNATVDGVSLTTSASDITWIGGF